MSACAPKPVRLGRRCRPAAGPESRCGGKINGCAGSSAAAAGHPKCVPWWSTRSFFLSIVIPQGGGRSGIFQIRTLRHGFSNIDSDSGKESFGVAPSLILIYSCPRRANSFNFFPPQKSERFTSHHFDTLLALGQILRTGPGYHYLINIPTSRNEH